VGTVASWGQWHRGDSGIGRTAAIAFAREGADLAIAYWDEHGVAKGTAQWVEKAGRRCTLYAGDIGDDAFCRQIVEKMSFPRLAGSTSW